jgi:hypothetical protein
MHAIKEVRFLPASQVKLIKVMANEKAFKIIDIEDAIARVGYISDSEHWH